MRKLGVWLLLVFALALLGASAVGALAVRDQLHRDGECAANVHRHVSGIEAFRVDHGRLPRRDELRGGGMPVIDYRIVSTDGYELTLWRGERSVHYASATGQNTCDSGALQAALWLAALLILPGSVLLFWTVRSLRAA